MQRLSVDHNARRDIAATVRIEKHNGFAVSEFCEIISADRKRLRRYAAADLRFSVHKKDFTVFEYIIIVRGRFLPAVKLSGVILVQNIHSVIAVIRTGIRRIIADIVVQRFVSDRIDPQIRAAFLQIIARINIRIYIYVE